MACPYEDEGILDEACPSDGPIQVAIIGMMTATEEEDLALPMARVEGNPSDYESESQESNSHPLHSEPDWRISLTDMKDKIEFCLLKFEEWEKREPPVTQQEIFYHEPH